MMYNPSSIHYVRDLNMPYEIRPTIIEAGARFLSCTQDVWLPGNHPYTVANKRVIMGGAAAFHHYFKNDLPEVEPPFGDLQLVGSNDMEDQAVQWSAHVIGPLAKQLAYVGASHVKTSHLGMYRFDHEGIRYTVGGLGPVSNFELRLDLSTKTFVYSNLEHMADVNDFVLNRAIKTHPLERVLFMSFNGPDQIYYQITLASILNSYEFPLKSKIARFFSKETADALHLFFAQTPERIALIKNWLIDYYPESYPTEKSVDEYFEYIQSLMNPDLVNKNTRINLLEKQLERQHQKIEKASHARVALEATLTQKNKITEELKEKSSLQAKNEKGLARKVAELLAEKQTLESRIEWLQKEKKRGQAVIIPIEEQRPPSPEIIEEINESSDNQEVLTLTFTGSEPGLNPEPDAELKSEPLPEPLPEAGIYSKIVNLIYRDIFSEKQLFNQSTPLETFMEELDRLDPEQKKSLNSHALKLNIYNSLEHAWAMANLYKVLITRLSQANQWSDMQETIEGLAVCLTDVARGLGAFKATFSNDKLISTFDAIILHFKCMMKDEFFRPENPSEQFLNLQAVVDKVHEKRLGIPNFDLAIKYSLDRIRAHSEVYVKYQPCILEARNANSPLSDMTVDCFFKDIIAVGFMMPKGYLFEEKLALIWATHITRNSVDFQELTEKVGKIFLSESNVNQGMITVWSMAILDYQNNLTKSRKINSQKLIKTMRLIFSYMRGRFPNRTTIQHLSNHTQLCQAMEESLIIDLSADVLHEIMMANFTLNLCDGLTSANELLSKFRSLNPFDMSQAELSDDYEVCQVTKALLIHTVYQSSAPERLPVFYRNAIDSLQTIINNTSSKINTSAGTRSTTQPVLTSARYVDPYQDKSSARSKYLYICLDVYNRQAVEVNKKSKLHLMAEEKIKSYFQYSIKQSPSEPIHNFIADYFLYLEQRKTSSSSPFYLTLTPLLSDDFLENIQFLHGTAKSKKIDEKLEEACTHLRLKNLFSFPEQSLSNQEFCKKAIYDILSGYMLTVNVTGNTYRLKLIADIIVQLNVGEVPDLPTSKSNQKMHAHSSSK